MCSRTAPQPERDGEYVGHRDPSPRLGLDRARRVRRSTTPGFDRTVSDWIGDTVRTAVGEMAGCHPMSAAVQAVGLTKDFGSVMAVDAVDFEVAEGSIVGLLGPN